MIYFDDHIRDFDLPAALSEVSPQRRQYALRYRQEIDQRLSVAAYRLLHRALCHEYGITEMPQFDYDDKGKPSLKGHPGIHFSLSHCRHAVVCAVSDQPVGIDIESLDIIDEHVASSVMSENEIRQVATAGDRDIAFYRLWTMKESLYKLTGDDHGDDIKHMLELAPPVTFETIVYPHSVCTICHYKTKK